MIRRTIVHRQDRRKLGRGQYPTVASVNATVTSTGTTNVTITFDQPVSISGLFPISITGKTVSTQVVHSPTQITLVASANVAGVDWVIPANGGVALSRQGGEVAGNSGTF